MSAPARIEAPPVLDGVIVVDKPGGLTSHDVVERVRRFVRPARVGHTGTLDPMATGVLALCCGAATRLARLLSSGVKEYTGEIVFGTATDTDDADGRAVFTGDAAALTLASVREAALALTGEIDQIPPAVSAKKVLGRRSYDAARAGDDLPLAPCGVRVDRFEIGGIEGARSPFVVTCSAGTYVRALARDLGRALGCGAHLGAIRRVRSGPFLECDAVPLSDLEVAGRAGRILEHLRPIHALDLGIPTQVLSRDEEDLVRSGRTIAALLPFPKGPLPLGTMVRLLGFEGDLAAVAEVVPGGMGTLQPRIVLPRRRPDPSALQDPGAGV